MFSWLAFVATIAAGPLAFGLFSRVLYRHRVTIHWPVGIADVVGDALLLPTFNGFAVGAGLSFSPWRLTAAIAFAFASAIAFYALFHQPSKRSVVNWAKLDDYRPNAGGWWHLGLLFAEVGFVAYAFLVHPGSIVLWALIVAFLLTCAYDFWALPERRPA